MKVSIKLTHQIKLFHRRTNGKVKIWECWIQGRWVCSRWGVEGGRTNETKEQPKVDRNWDKDEDDEVVVLFKRKIAQKKKKGYVESLATVVADVKVDDAELDFDCLPRNFAPAKPIKKVDLDTVLELDARGLLYIQRKRDGQRHYLVSDTKGRTRIYSSGKEDKTEHMKPLISGLKLPPRTILDVELVATLANRHESDDFNFVSGIARSLPERARKLIHDGTADGVRIQLMAFDLLWENGEPTYRRHYRERYTRLAKVIGNGYTERGMTIPPPLIRMPLLNYVPSGRHMELNEARALAKLHHWEGLVLWRVDEATVVQVNGTPKRVNCWKDKLVKEEDVVVTGYELGKGKNRNVVGKFNIAMYNGLKNTKPFYIPMGRCGTGLDDETRKAALRWKYPCVIQIEYDTKSDKGFRFPVFIRKRDDKNVSECVG